MIKQIVPKRMNKVSLILFAISLMFCLLASISCKKKQVEPELKDYYDPYAPVPKSKFDSVKAAQVLLARTSGNNSLELLTEKPEIDECDHKNR